MLTRCRNRAVIRFLRGRGHRSNCPLPPASYGLPQLLGLSPGARNRPHQVYQVPLLLLKEGWPARRHPEC